MREKVFALIVALLLSLSLAAPAFAYSEYGVIYDETEQLYSEELERLGKEVLPALTARYGIDLRVDILTDTGSYGSDLAAVAEHLYEEYGYGSGEGRNGMTLTLLVHGDETGFALDLWHPYAGGTSWELTTNGTWNICRNADTWLSEEAWSGGLEDDIAALTGAVRDMAEGLESFVLAGGVQSTIWSPVTESLVTESGETEPPAEEPADPSDTVSQVSNITDTAGLLTESERETLEQQARTLSEAYGCGVYVVTVEDYEDYVYGDAEAAAEALYRDLDLGIGAERDGVLLLLSMSERDYSLIANGGFGHYAFSLDGLDALASSFLDDFAGDDWYGGLSDYLGSCESYLAAAENGEPYSGDNVPMGAGARSRAILTRVAIIFLLPLIIAGIVILVLTSRMKSVAAATEAENYITDSLILSDQYDRYTYSTETRRKVSSDSGSKRSGGRKGKF